MRHTDYYKRIFSTLVAIVVAIVTSSAQSLVYVETDHEGTYEKKITGDRLPDYNFSINEYGIYTYYFYIKNTSGQAGTVKPTSIELLNDYAKEHLSASFCYNGTCYPTIEQCQPFEIDAYGEFRGGKNFDGSLITEGSGLDMQIMYKGRPEPGTAEIKLSFQFEHDTNPSICYLSLNFTPIDISLDKEEMTLEIGEEESLVARINGIPNNTDIDWKSDNPDIATVNVDGIVKAISQGTTTIYATAKGSMYFATCKVTVKSDKATDIVLDKNELTLNIGDKERLTATVLPESAKDKSVRWYSSAQRIATVNADGVVTAISVGTAVITVTTNDGSDLTASCTVTVTPKTVQSITMDEEALTLERGETTRLTVTVSPSDADDTSVTWRSNNSNVAIVDGSGKVAALEVGTAIISATTNDGSGLSARCTVTVIPKDVDEITLNKERLEMEIGDIERLTAIVSPDDADDKTVTWQSTDSKVASVNSDGVVTARSAGEATITATTSNGLTAECQVEVTDPNGIADTDADNVKVTVQKGRIIVESLPAGWHYSIHDMSGSTVYIGSGTEVEVASGNVYVVQIKDSTRKLFVP